jgi:hypothetical protein
MNKELHAIIEEAKLSHSGVRGMRWGVRRSDKQLGVAAKAREKSDEASGSKPKSGRKEAKANAKASEKAQKVAEGSQGKRKGGKGDIKKDADKTRYGSSPKKLTNDELTARIKRMETEKRYTDLNKKTVSAGQKMTSDILKTVGKDSAIKLLSGTTAFGMKRTLEKQFNIDVANAILPKVKSGRVGDSLGE